MSTNPRRSDTRGAALALSVAFALTGTAWAAKPPLQFKPVVTKGWQGELPHNWTLEVQHKSAEAEDRGLWIYGSPNRNLKLRLRIRLDRGEPMAGLVESNLNRMLGRSKEAKVLSKEVGPHGYTAIIRTPMRRRDFLRDFLVFRIMTRDPATRLRITMTFAGTPARMETFRTIVDHFVKTFDLLAKSPPPQAPSKPTLPGGPAAGSTAVKSAPGGAR